MAHKTQTVKVYKTLPMPIEYGVGKKVMFNNYSAGTIITNPKQVMLYFEVQVQLKDGGIISAATHNLDLISDNVFAMVHPAHCGICRKWFDVVTDVKHPMMCRECFNKWAAADQKTCVHHEIEIDARVIGELQFNCDHWYVCSECGMITGHYDSSG